MLLKASSKSTLTKKLLSRPSALSGMTGGQRTITNHHVYEAADLRTQAVKDILDTQAKVTHHVGYLRLNREHRYNTLTSNYIKNIKRCLTTLHQDDLVKLIYMTGGQREHFCNGTDFRSLLYHKQKGEQDSISQYLTDLYSLQTLTAKINKPILAAAPGHSFNSGATFLQATGIPTATVSSKIAFNEVQFGFVPHGGSTYYLSRMPGELGTFLALTGFPLTGIDAKELGFAELFIHLSKPFELDLSDNFKSIDFPIPSVELLSDNGRLNPWLDHLRQKKSETKAAREGDLKEMNRKQHLVTEFYEPKDKIPKTQAASDYQYKKWLEEYNRLHIQDPQLTEPTYLGYDMIYKQNYFEYVADWVKREGSHTYDLKEEGIRKHLQEIDRCFYSSTLEEIMENLKREGTPWARKVLEQMNKNSTLSMKLALKMMRQARNLDYKGCLKNEINVALNKIQDSEFDLGVSQILMKPGKEGTAPKFSKDVPNDKVASFFEKNKMLDSVELDVVEKALLPTRFFYNEYVDAARLWLNEESTPQAEVREYFEIELKNSLRELGIDIRDRALTIESARDHIYRQQMLDRNQQVFEERLKHFFSDEKLRERYYQEARDEVAYLETNQDAFYQRVNQKIQEVFEQAYIQKLDNIYERSKEVHQLEKRRMFIKFKKFFFQSRILTLANSEFDKIAKKLQSMPFKEVHLTENWDTSFVHQEHPDLQQSILYHIQKVVGRKTIVPLELAKEYVKDPQQAKRQTLLTFDKKELLKLRRDILENPEKYEKMLTKQQENTAFKRNWNDGGRKLDDNIRKSEQYNYWYRILNQGRNPWDNVKDYQTFLIYKEFVDSIETKALDTLRFIVQKLLNDFEQVDQIKEYAQDQKETKRESINRLMSMLYQQDTPKEVKKRRGKEDAKILEVRRPLSEIKRTVNNLLLQDPLIKHLIPQNEENHTLIHNFREEILDDLYKLLEVVLLNNDPNYPLTKEVLEQRLAALTNPSNQDTKHITQMRLLDQFLHDHNAEQTIKHTLQLIKPFFYVHIMNKLDKESARICDAFRFHQTGEELLFYYVLQRNHPELFRSDVFRRLQTYHAEQDKQEYLDQVFPQETFNYKMKELISTLSTQIPLKNATVEEQEQALESNVTKQLEIVRKAKEQQDQWKQGLQQEIKKFKDEEGKRAIEEDMENMDIKDPQFNFYHFRNTQELESLAFHMENIDKLQDQFDQFGQELANQVSYQESMHMIWSLMTQHGYDITKIFRFCYNEEKFNEINFEQEMKNMFGGQANLTFHNVAEYAGFLSTLYHQAGLANSTASHQANFQEVFNQVIALTKNLDEISQESIFTNLVNSRAQHLNIGDRPKNIKQEIREFKEMQQQVTEQRRLKENIRKYQKEAPESIKQQIEGILETAEDSKYVDLAKLEATMAKLKRNGKDKSEAEKILRSQPLEFINKEAIIRDIQRDQLVPNFLKNYHQVPLDVVSLAQTKTMINEAKEDQILNKKLKAQISFVLDFISDQLKQLPHSRRKAMKLGEFIKRHQLLNGYMNNGSFSVFADQILKNKIENTLGNVLNPLDDFDVIDWEYAGYKTNPISHQQKDAKIQKAWNQNESGESLNEEQELNQFFGKELTETKDPHTNEVTSQKNINHEFINRFKGYVDEETGIYEEKEESELAIEEVLIDARKEAEIKPEFMPIRNQYENLILALYTSDTFDGNELEALINDYTEMRLKDLLLQDGVRAKVYSNNGHYYLKMLKEQIAKELNLLEETKTEQLLYDNLYTDHILKIEAGSRYNLSTLINDEAVGYDNLKERIENPAKNKQLAHETLFDKLLSEYFTSKRKAFTNVNELVDRISEQFDDSSYKPGHPSWTKDKAMRNPADYPHEGEVQLSYRKLQQDITKSQSPIIRAQDFTELMELDIITSQALQDNKNGLSVELRQDMPEEAYTIPDYYELFDPRKPPKKYVDDKLTQIIDEVFQMRRKLEKSFSRRELLAYDKILIRHLTHDTLHPKLKKEIEADYFQAVQNSQMLDAFKEGEKENTRRQFMKSQNKQADDNKAIKNEDAIYKFLTYSAMIEKNFRDDYNKNRKNERIPYEMHSFHEYYKFELEKDFHLEPRPINEADYTERKRFNQAQLDEGFQTYKEIKNSYFGELDLYKENKKETIERNQTYFILEQLKAQTEKKKEPLNQAQQAIMDYFQDPENTYFFNRNKIQFDQQ